MSGVYLHLLAFFLLRVKRFCDVSTCFNFQCSRIEQNRNYYKCIYLAGILLFIITTLPRKKLNFGPSKPDTSFCKLLYSFYLSTTHQQYSCVSDTNCIILLVSTSKFTHVTFKKTPRWQQIILSWCNIKLSNLLPLDRKKPYTINLSSD